MTIVGFNIINPVMNKKRPFFDKKSGLFIFHLDKNYKYYVECSNINEEGITEYYLLFGEKEFDENCRRCRRDDYGRYKIKPKGDILTYISRESEERGNIKVEYDTSIKIDGGLGYDVYKLI